MLNDTRVTVTGNVCRPPQLRNRQSDGRPFTVVPVAVNTRRFDRTVQRWIEDSTAYYDITCHGTTGANALACLEVGTPVVAHGTLRLREWERDSARGVTPSLRAESIGIDLTWGTAAYTRGIQGYPVDTASSADATADPVSSMASAPGAGASDPTREAGPIGEDEPLDDGPLDDEPLGDEVLLADADGVVDDAVAERLLARTA